MQHFNQLACPSTILLNLRPPQALSVPHDSVCYEAKDGHIKVTTVLFLVMKQIKDLDIWFSDNLLHQNPHCSNVTEYYV